MSPFALVNNIEKDIRVLFDAELEGKLVGFHPLQNDNTIVLEMSEMEKFLENITVEYIYHEL